MPLQHIAIIMDGNGRWAKKRGLPRVEGHRAGTRAAGRVARAARRMNVPYLTLYTLSTENLYRPQEELDGLMALMRHYLENEAPKLIENRIRLKVIGDRAMLPADVLQSIRRAEKKTARDYAMTLSLAICYGGRDEIVRAVRSLAPKMDLEKLTEGRLSRALDLGGIPDPDLLVRTGGDKRVSNFLLWEIAYAELYFTKTLWPEFSSRHLRAAVESFEKRERRFGRTEKTHYPDQKAARKKRGRLR